MWPQHDAIAIILGFMMMLIPHSETACSDSITADYGYIFSPTSSNTPLSSTTATAASHGNYPDNSDCTYTIRTRPGSMIKLNWVTFDLKGIMPTCWPDDYVEVFIGCNYKSIGKYCDTNSYSPFDMYSPDNCMKIKFKSDGSEAGTGFMAKFQAISSTKASLSGLSCSTDSYYGRSKSGLSGTIGSPGWPAPFSAVGQSCYWRIEVGSGYGIKLAIMDFDLPSDFGCDDSKIKITGDDSRSKYSKADNTIKSSSCGSKSPSVYTSSMKYVWIRFKRPYQNYDRKRGFVAGYVRYKQSIKDTGSVITGAVVGVIVAIAFLGCIIFICVRRRRAAMHRPPPTVIQSQQVPMVPPPTQSYPAQPYPAQSYPAQPPPGGQMMPPPTYGQATGIQYPPPIGPGALPPKTDYPPPGQYPQQGYYPPPSGPPPPGGSPYPPPQGGPAPYPSGPPPGGAPYPPAAGSAPPYPAPDGSAPPYPTEGQQPYPPPGQAPYPPQ